MDTTRCFFFPSSAGVWYISLSGIKTFKPPTRIAVYFSGATKASQPYQAPCDFYRLKLCSLLEKVQNKRQKLLRGDTFDLGLSSECSSDHHTTCTRVRKKKKRANIFVVLRERFPLIFGKLPPFFFPGKPIWNRLGPLINTSTGDTNVLTKYFESQRRYFKRKLRRIFMNPRLK